MLIKTLIDIMEKNAKYRSTLDGYDVAIANLNSKDPNRIIPYFNTLSEASNRILNNPKELEDEFNGDSKAVETVLKFHKNLAEIIGKSLNDKALFESNRQQLLKLAKSYRDEEEKNYLGWLNTKVK